MTFLELRRTPGKLLKAIDGGQEVTLSRRGKEIARITPLVVDGASIAARDHEAFGMWADRQDVADPAEHVSRLRRG
jgi:antitoxin (DNA-binding transcriptional repressor) of toxin-antitoxin stability system